MREDKRTFANEKSSFRNGVTCSNVRYAHTCSNRTCAQFQFQTGAILIAIYFPYTVRLRPVLPSLRVRNVLASVNSSTCLPLVNQ